MDQTLLRVATKEREEIKRTTKQKMARRHNKEGGNHLEKESNRQTTMEDIDGGLHPAVNGQSLDEDEGEVCFPSKSLPPMLECAFESRLGPGLSGFRMWQFLKLVVGCFLRVLRFRRHRRPMCSQVILHMIMPCSLVRTCWGQFEVRRL